MGVKFNQCVYAIGDCVAICLTICCFIQVFGGGEHAGTSLRDMGVLCCSYMVAYGMQP